jgi:MFS transporter, DHA2 family, multidrug resistance protein
MNVVKYRWLTVTVLSLVGLVIGLDTTVLNVALPTLAEKLGATTSQLQWFADAYLLALAVCLLPAGLLGDRCGRKATTLVALLVFGTGSLWSAYAPSAAHLIAARSLMGVGAAMATPLTFSWLVVLFDEDERPRALGLLGAASFLGLPLGPILAGWLLQHHRWGSVFLINVPLVGLALVGSVVLLPAHSPRSDRRVDGVGIALSVAGLAGLTYGLIEAPVRGWGDLRSLAGWITGLVVLAAFAERELRQGDNGLMNMRLWREPTFAWGTGVLSVATMLGMVALFSVPIYLQGVLGVDAMGSGLRLTPMIGGIVLGVVISVIFTRRVGYRATLLFGLAAIAAAAGMAGRTTLESGYGWAAVWLTSFGIGFGALMISCQNLALSRLDQNTAGAGAATVQVMRQTGSVVGIAVLVSVLNTVYRDRVATTGLRAPVAAAVRDSVQAGLAVAERFHALELTHSVRTAFLHGMAAQMGLGVALAGAVAVAVIIWMPRRLGTADPESPSTATTRHADEPIGP